MASAGQVIERFAAVSGSLPSTLDRMLRPLREAGLVPMGEKGRGQGGQYEPPHLAAVVFAFAGHQPSDAATAAAALSALRYRETDPKDAPPPVDPTATLGDTVAESIREAARHLVAKAKGKALDQVAAVPAWINLPMSAPRVARVMWASPAHGLRRNHLYYPVGAYSANHVVMRETTVSQHLLWAAGALWADTLARRDGDAATLAFFKAQENIP